MTDQATGSQPPDPPPSYAGWYGGTPVVPPSGPQSGLPGVPGTWPVPPQPELADPGYPRALLGLFGVGAGAGVLLAVLGGWLWSLLADPPSAPLHADGGVLLGEQALNQQAGGTLWFLVVGAALGALSGVVVAWFGRRVGWPTVVVVLLMCAIAAAGSRWLGVHAFGPDPHAELAHARPGDLIRLNLGLQTWVAYLGWGIGGMAGAVAAIAGWSIRRRPSPTPHLASGPLADPPA